MADAMWLDGNAIAGMLSDAMGGEMTSAPRVCSGCGAEREVGAMRLYRGAGLVLRCPECDQVAMQVATLPDRYLFQFTGSWTFTIPRHKEGGIDA
jgi:Family of unknown function (DUF6510)